MGSEDFYPEERPVRTVRGRRVLDRAARVTVEAFRRFVETTGHVTVAERTPSRADYPRVDPALLVPGSLVFQRAAAPVALDDHRAGGRMCPARTGGNPRVPDPRSTPVPSTPSRMWRTPTPPRTPLGPGARSRPRPSGSTRHAEGSKAPTTRGATSISGRAGDGEHLARRVSRPEPVRRRLRRNVAVAAFPPNGFGLYDMTGNVWEWTCDPFSGGESSGDGSRVTSSRADRTCPPRTTACATGPRRAKARRRTPRPRTSASAASSGPVPLARQADRDHQEPEVQERTDTDDEPLPARDGVRADGPHPRVEHRRPRGDEEADGGDDRESYASPSCLPKIQYATIHARGHNAKTKSRAARMRLPALGTRRLRRVRCGRGSWPKEVIVARCSPRSPRPSSSEAGDSGRDLRPARPQIVVAWGIDSRLSGHGPPPAPPDGAVLRVVVADDSYLVREALRHLLDTDPRVDLVATCEDGRRTGRDGRGASCPTWSSPTSACRRRATTEGIVFANRLRETHPEIGVVVVSQYADPRYGAGAAGQRLRSAAPTCSRTACATAST